MTRTSSIAVAKLGEHRSKPRLWLEGRKLQRAGIEPGQKFAVIWDAEAQRVHLRFDDEGERTVSSRKRNGRELPIIDMPLDELESIFGSRLERALVRIGPKSISLDIHPDDARTRERFERLMAAAQSGRPLTTGSLAHGGGIIDHAIHTGLEASGLEAKLAFAVEIDGSRLDVAASNNPIWDEDTIQVEAPMQAIDPSLLPKVDILVAGLPCVGASKSGKAKNAISSAEEHPTAGILFFSALQTIKHCNPSLVVLENVVEYGNELSATVIRSALREWGYELHEIVLHGSDFGAIENRKRLCFVGVTKELPFDISTIALHTVPSDGRRLGDVLEEIDLESDSWMDISYLMEKAERDRAAGKNFKLNVVSPGDRNIGTIGAGYSKWRQTEPKIAHPTKPNHARQLTPREHALVKGIPPELVAGISNTLAHEILGNSVIWPAFRAVGAMVGAQVAAEAGRRPPVAVKVVSARPDVQDPMAETVGALRQATRSRGIAPRRMAAGLATFQLNLDFLSDLENRDEATAPRM